MRRKSCRVFWPCLGHRTQHSCALKEGVGGNSSGFLAFCRYTCTRNRQTFNLPGPSCKESELPEDIVKRKKFKLFSCNMVNVQWIGGQYRGWLGKGKCGLSLWILRWGASGFLFQLWCLTISVGSRIENTMTAEEWRSQFDRHLGNYWLKRISKINGR